MARQHILDRIRDSNAQAGRTPSRGRPAAAANPAPARARVAGEAAVALFVAMAREAAASVARIASAAALPGEVALYLARHNLPAVLTVAPDPALDDIPWPAQPTLSVRRGAATPADAVGLTAALGGVAETGSLLVCSGATRPYLMHFLPDTHIAVVRAGDIVGAYEQAWLKLGRPGAELPRAVTLITGPSRTSDIEKTLQIGIHGPRRLHIVVIDDAQD